jgi:transcriptional regulator with XRE-family HTH domain
MKEITFGTKIKALRQERKLTLKDLSEKSGIEITYLSKIENDKTGTPKESTIDKLISALKINLDTKEELFRLAKRLPHDLKEGITKSKAFFDVFRAAKDLSEKELEGILEEIEIKKRKRADHENTKK